MTVSRRAFAFILAAGLAGSSAIAMAAATNAVPGNDKVEPLETVRLLDDARVSMKDAIAAAEKANGAKALRATLRDTRNYGLVWDVRMEKGDKDSRTRVRTLVDAKTGQVLASDVNEIDRSQYRGYGRHCDENGGRRYGYDSDYRGARGEHHCR